MINKSHMLGKLLYITTTLPYVNSDPHIGFAMEIIRADVIARYHRSLGEEVFFNTGTDEHGAKIYENAVKSAMSPKAYVDGYAMKFKELITLLNISDVNFIRTTDEKHILAAQAMWKRCEARGDIYKKLYKIKYCVGCELEKTDGELIDGKCPIHTNRDVEIREEDNYFFKFSKYKTALLLYYEANPDFVIPDFRFNEIKAFVNRGLEDFSISRIREKMPWGVPVPGDNEHVMYVWFDALTSYISTLGWPHSAPASRGAADRDDFDFWIDGTPVQYCGKDNLRQQSAMWQAMLMSAGINNSSHIVIDGFITSGGVKMSKSLGNVISPFDVVERFNGLTDFPEDVLRFALLHDISSFEDGDITMSSMEESYQAHLANGIGNLTNRIMKMATSNGVVFSEEEAEIGLENQKVIAYEHMYKLLEKFNAKKALEYVVLLVNILDKSIQNDEPYKKVKDPVTRSQGLETISKLLVQLYNIALNLEIFLPRTSAKILECIRENKMPEKPLFNRLS